MVIDDNKEILEYTLKILKKFGYKVFTASNCKNISEILKKNKRIDLFIVDYIMPDTGGFKCIKNIRDYLDYNAKYVLSSGMGSDKIREECEINKIDAFLPKPYTMGDLLMIIQSVLED